MSTHRVLHTGLMLVVSLALAAAAWGALPAPKAAAAACTFTSNATGNWSAAGTWSAVGTACGTYPGASFAGDTVVISNNRTVTLDVSPANSIASLALNGAGQAARLTISGSNSLNVTGNVSVAAATGATNGIAVNAGTLTVGGNLTLNGGAVSRQANLTISTGTVTVTGNIVLVDGGGGLGLTHVTFSGAGTLNVGGTYTSGGDFTPGTGTVNYNGAAQTVATFATTTYNNLTLSGSGAKTFQVGTTSIGGNLTLSGTATATTAAAMTIGGNLSIGDGTTFTAAGFDLTVTGTTTVGGGTSGNLTISSATGTKTFDGLVTINLGGTWTNTAANSAVTFHGGITNNGTFNAGTGVHTFDTNAQALAGTLSIPNVTVTGVTLTNNGTFTVGTALAGSGELTNSATGTLNISFTGAVGITTLTASAAGNTVNYKAAGAQTVRAITYSNLIFSGSGAKTVATGTLVNGNLSIAPTGTATGSINPGLNIPVGSLTLGGLGRINGTWGSTSSTATNQNDTYFAATTGIVTVSTDTRATPTLSVTNSPVTYNGSPHAATVNGSVPGTVSNILAGGSATQTDAGTYAVTADFVPADTTSYTSLTGASAGNFVINRATPTLSVTNSPVTYNGSPQAASVAGSVAGTVSNVQYNGSATVPTDAGTYAITADFAPTDSTNYNSLTGASAGNFIITPANTTTSLTSSANPSAFGASVTFTATVAPSAATGTVQFYADGATLGSLVTLSGGTASVSTAALSVGTHTITATYSGDANYTGSSGTLVPDQVVTPASTTTSLASSANPSAFGQSVTFTATVSVVPPDTGTPTGNVSFYDGGTLLGNGTLNGSSYATFTTSSLIVGGHVITAAYAGDSHYNGSTSAVLNQIVTDTPITGLSAVNDSPTMLGNATLFTATATGSNILYTWDFGEGHTANGPTASNTYTAVGFYTVHVTATNGVSQAVATTPVTITDTPITGLSAVNSSPTTLGQATFFTATATGSNIVYTWNFSDGSTASGARANHVYALAGFYTARVTATNGVSQVVATTPVTITFVSVTHTLVVNETGNGSGTINPPVGTHIYDYGTVVTLTATPSIGSSFAGWSGACTNISGDCVVTLDADKAVTATFTLNAINNPPIANAGLEQTAYVNSTVTLNGSASSDPDGDLPLTYGWTRIGGPSVVFNTALSVTAFTAPSTPTVLTFTLTVTDTKGLASSPDTVVITVKDHYIYLPVVMRNFSQP